MASRSIPGWIAWPGAATPADDPSELARATNDETLVAAAQQDPTAFAPLYHRYAGPIYGYCALRLGDRDLAEDATSQTFEKALAGLPRYRAKSFRGWLFTIARHVVIDYQRARPTAPLAGVAALHDRAASPEETALADDADRNVRRLLALLTRDQREVVELRLAGLSGTEIAKVLGRRPGAVRAAQFRAFQTLREFLTEEGDRP